MARIAPLPPADWSPELSELISGFRTAVVGEEAVGSAPSGANLLGTLARHPALTKSFLAFNGQVLYGTTLSTRHRELLVLRVAHVRGCDYEWAQHVLLARDAGMTEEEIDRVTEGPGAPGWAPGERALVSAVDELLAGATVSAPTWDVLTSEFKSEQLLDIVFTVGTYDMVACVLRTFAVEPEDDLVPHLPRGR